MVEELTKLNGKIFENIINNRLLTDLKKKLNS